MGRCKIFIYALNEDNISIKGEGVIDLSGESFFDFSKTLNPIENIDLLTPEQIEETEAKPLERPNQPIFFYNCKNLTIENVTFKDSPCWTISINSSEGIRIRGIKIINNLRIPNSDGVHLCSCRDVSISECKFVCGDDCIALTGITNWDKPCENVMISDCFMETRSAGVRIGHLDSKVQDVKIKNLIISNSNRGIGIFANGSKGYVKNIYISNVIADTHIYAGTWWGKGEPLVIQAPESGNFIEDIKIENLIARSENGIVIWGKDRNIRNVELRNVLIGISYGKNRELFGRYIDLQPSGFQELKEYKSYIPWVILKSVENFNYSDVLYYKESSDKVYSIEKLEL